MVRKSITTLTKGITTIPAMATISLAGIGISTAIGISSAMIGLGGSAHADGTPVVTRRDQLTLQIDSRCAFKTATGEIDGDAEYNGTVDNRGEAVFDNNGKHNFNIACNQSSGYTVRAYATDLEKSDDSTTTIPFTNYSNYNAYIAEHDGAAVWTAEVLDNNTIAGLTPQFGTSSTDTQIIKTTSGPSELTGDEFSVTYKAHVSQSTIPGTYSGTAVYTLLLNPYTPTTYRYIIRYHADGSPAVPQNQSGEANIADPTTAVTLSNLSPIKDNYHLAGWRMSENGDSEIEAENQVYAPGSTFTIAPTHSIVDLYVVWEENTTPTDIWGIVYNANGGTNAPEMATIVATPGSDAEITITSTIPNRTGYRFFGWSTNPSAANPDVGFEVGKTPTITLNESVPSIALYALWKEMPHYFQDAAITTQAEAKEICQGLAEWTSSNNVEYALYDSRDEKGYLVRRLADGNCWMVQNLALDSGTTEATRRTITSADSNITSDYVLPMSKQGPSGTWSDNASQYMWNGKHEDVKKDTAVTTSGTGTSNTGAYYSFLTATAGTGTGSSGEASSSICPKWWHLPTGGYDSTADFNKLYAAYGSSSSAIGEAFNVALTGSCSDGGCPYKTDGAHYWSAGISSSTAGYSFYTNNTGDTRTSQGTYKKAGHSIRCVLSGN